MFHACTASDTPVPILDSTSLKHDSSIACSGLPSADDTQVYDAEESSRRFVEAEQHLALQDSARSVDLLTAHAAEAASPAPALQKAKPLQAKQAQPSLPKPISAPALNAEAPPGSHEPGVEIPKQSDRNERSQQKLEPEIPKRSERTERSQQKAELEQEIPKRSERTERSQQKAELEQEIPKRSERTERSDEHSDQMTVQGPEQIQKVPEAEQEFSKATVHDFPSEVWGYII